MDTLIRLLEKTVAITSLPMNIPLVSIGWKLMNVFWCIGLEPNLVDTFNAESAWQARNCGWVASLGQAELAELVCI